MNNIIRHIQSEIVGAHNRPRGRLLALTGARQCGKTTLARMAFPDYPEISLDAPMERTVYAEMAPGDWLTRYPRAVLDEVQKLPPLLDTVKACYDRSPECRYILLGSSQILMMRQMGESLAGRVAIHELYPFSLPELAEMRLGATVGGEGNLLTLLLAQCPYSTANELFPPDAALSTVAAALKQTWEYFECWGGMPRIADPEWTDEERRDWLVDYQNTYLRRDLADIARLDRLEPFVRAQKAAAMRTAQTINYSELARLSEVSPPTAKEFMRYLEISYQVIQLPAWFSNQEKRLAKQPKLHFLDPGVRRAIIRNFGEPDGAEFESAVVAEVFKRVRSHRVPVQLHHLRTNDGREVDLLIEREDGFIAIECKRTANPSPVDARHLRRLGELLDKPLLLGIVACLGRHVRVIPDEHAKIMAVPAHILLA